MLIHGDKESIDGHHGEKKGTRLNNNVNENARNPSGTEDGFKTKLQNIFSNITVEPILAFYVVPAMIMFLAVQNLNLDKACRVNLQYDPTVCDRIIAQNTSNLTGEVQEIQKIVAKMQVWKLPLQTALPAILIVFIGSYSDRTGRRKFFMMMPAFGESITCIGLLLCVYYFLEWSLEVAALIEAIPVALGGGISILFMSVNSYLADITSRENRTFRLGVANIIAVIGMPIGQSLSGVLIRYVGYYGVFCTIGVMYLTALTYTWIRITDENVKESNDNVESCLSFFSPKHFVDTFMVVLKPRKGLQRFKLILLVFMGILAVGPMFGEFSILYLFVRYKFNMTEIEYSVYGTYSSVVHLSGTMFAIVILNRRYKLNDYYLGILAGLSKLAASFVFVFAPSVRWFYVGPLVECFSGFANVIVKTIVSKIVEPHEVGRMYSILGILESMAPTIFSPIYNKVYLHTLDVLPGGFFFIGSLTSFLYLMGHLFMCFTSYDEDYISNVGDNAGPDAVKEDVDWKRRAEKEMYAYDNEVTAM